MKEFLEKRGWLFLLIPGLILFFAGVRDILLGIAVDPAPSFVASPFFVRTTGLAFLGLGFLATLVSTIPLKRGEKWAWYSLWSVPIVFYGLAMINYRAGGGLWAYQLILGISAAFGLLLWSIEK